jgi:hypothetical protein
MPHVIAWKRNDELRPAAYSRPRSSPYTIAISLSIGPKDRGLQSRPR